MTSWIKSVDACHICCSDTIEELKEWKSKFEERIALLETKIRKMEREMDDTETTISSLHNAKTNYMLEISKLQTEAEVNLTKLPHTKIL